MAELTVGAGFARGLMQLALARGADEAALSAQSGIDAAMLADQDARVPFARYVALMRAAKTLCGEPALALHYGETMDLSDFSIVGLIAHAAETMADALVQLNRFGRLVVEFDGGAERFQNRVIDGQIWLVDTRDNPNDFPELTESTFARMACGPRRFAESLRVGAVHVTHGKPAHHAEYDRIFGAPTVFNADKNALLLDESWLTHRIALTPRYVFGILSEHAEALLTSLETSKTVRGQVESLLLPVLHTGNANIDRIAGAMGMSRATLFRRLRVENTSFEMVLDALRHRMALHYLAGRRVSVNETAYLVGFSEPAAFSRAFKRWTGRSPKTARAPAALSRVGS